MITVKVYGDHCAHDTDVKGSEDFFEKILRALFHNAPDLCVIFQGKVRNRLPNRENFFVEILVRGTMEHNSSRHFPTPFEAVGIAQIIAHETDELFACNRCPEQSTYCVLVPPNSDEPVIATTAKIMA